MLNSLQAGRALAALAVVVFHLTGMSGLPAFGGTAIFQEYTALGYLGVDFFFALSGFIIMAAHHADMGRPDRLKDFLVKRFIRIYPLYWIITGIILLGAFLTQGVSRLPSGFWDATSMMTLVHLNPFRPPAAPAWTLFHEIFFYALMGLAIWNRFCGVAAMLAWAVLLLANSFASLRLEYTADLMVQTLTMPVNMAFFGGLGAYFLYRRMRRNGAAVCCVAGVAGLAAWLMLVVPAADAGLFKLGLAVFFMGIIGGFAALEKSGLRLDIPILTAIGNASFMLYLTHENIQSAAMKIFIRWFPDYVREYPSLTYLTVVALCVLFALAAYRWLEKPLLRYLKSKLLHRPPEPAAAHFKPFAPQKPFAAPQPRRP